VPDDDRTTAWSTARHLHPFIRACAPVHNTFYPVKIQHLLPLIALFTTLPTFAQEDVVAPKEEKIQLTEPVQPEVFTGVEEMPQFPGGEQALYAYIKKELKYPQMAKENETQGTVYVTFVVQADGTITNPKVIRGIGGGCDEEAIRIVKGMPQWTPGKQGGKPVRVQYNLPIRFKLY
jgi:protein TonB